MSDYTPTTEEVRQAWIGQERMRDSMRGVVVDKDEQYHAEFDRWLAEVERAAAEKAWDEAMAAAEEVDGPNYLSNPYRKGAV